ncbi:CRAL/TRIO domain-containing protein [Rhizoclosmatium globosum]|uniref:CRAL/TRIO domain-containing protein n=1 Tax=Rhizoclosmatium globosum TaxID=329046 RepID=A0A1Y2BXT6_9FUNG|nr:CRAL/TRIO domain-containing protein [Rhizoclosmatium globosum]|eukprot:ORY39582.1 CRAL/TRIO domain-containing protein [Rhizoclosmatium globosum]
MPGNPILSPPELPPSQVPVLSAKQQQLIDQLRSRVPQLISSLKGGEEEQERLAQWTDESAATKRYLVDTKWDLEAAAVKLQATLQWRKEYKPDQIQPSEVEEEAVTGKGYISGFDKTGRPTLFIIPARDKSKDPERSLRFLVFLIEKITKLMPKGIEKMAVIVDYAGIGFFNGTPINVATKYLHVLQNHYPERLGVLCVVNPSLFLNGLFTLLKPLMDPVTVAKIHLLAVDKTSAAQQGQQVNSENGPIDLRSIFATSQLPREFGGSFDFQYNHTEYWPAIQRV